MASAAEIAASLSEPMRSAIRAEDARHRVWYALGTLGALESRSLVRLEFKRVADYRPHRVHLTKLGREVARLLESKP